MSCFVSGALAALSPSRPQARRLDRRVARSEGGFAAVARQAEEISTGR